MAALTEFLENFDALPIEFKRGFYLIKELEDRQIRIQD
jgi:hypothetical protein